MISATITKISSCILLLSCLAFSSPGLAWESPSDSLAQDSLQVITPINPRVNVLNVDSIYAAAKTAAFENRDFQLAIELCEKILAQNPRHYDSWIFLGRLLAWTGQYELAIAELEAVVSEQKYFDDARLALVDVYVWNKQYTQALDVIRTGLEINPLNDELYYKQAVCFAELSETQKARIALQKLMKIEPGHAKGRSMLERLSEDASLRKLTASYSYDRLTDTKYPWQVFVTKVSMDPWHLLTLEGEQSMDFGPLIARLSFANRFQQSGFQLELESYPDIRKGTYAYLGLGYSGTQLFPTARAGLEIFQALSRNYEISLGSRFLHLESEDIILFTGSAGKYWGNYWTNIRGFLSSRNHSSSLVLNTIVRRYLKDADSYLEVNLSKGESPDASPGLEELSYLNSWRLAVQFQGKIDDINLFKVGINVANIEIRPASYRGDTGLYMSYSRRF